MPTILSKKPEGKVSDQSRYRLTSQNQTRLMSILVGAFFGGIYAVLEWYLDYFNERVPHTFVLIHDIFDICIPVLFGIMMGLGYDWLRRQVYLNQALSTQNAHLKSRILTHILASHFLHEIRNPIHNLIAALEEPNLQLPNASQMIIQRNLERLNALTSRLKSMSFLGDDIPPTQPTSLIHWTRNYIENSFSPGVRADIKFQQYIEPITLLMHPLLLEQCFTILFDNALRAAQRGPTPRVISLLAVKESGKHGFAKIEIRNTGALFPQEVLDTNAQEQFSSSSQGLGIGLVLIHDTVEQIGGEMNLGNDGNEAVVTLWIPQEFRE